MDDLREVMGELGVHLSDTFGMDHVLWVEGPTEEACFPLLLERVSKRQLRGTRILSVKNTGDLQGKHRHMIFELYSRLSGGNNLLPPAIAFVFDHENKSEAAREKLREECKRQCKCRLEFLPRRMYENYLLHPEAVAEVANAIPGFRLEADQAVTPEQVRDWLDKNGRKAEYLRDVPERDSLPEQEWLNRVDGAKVLEDLFTDLSDSRVAYTKTRHSRALTEWVIEHAPETLREVAALLEEFFPASTNPPGHSEKEPGPAS